jgi:mRNA interferase HigB
MRVLGRKRLADFCNKYVDARDWIATWIVDVEAAVWRSPHDVRKRFVTASFLGDGRVIFNVKGNKYRLLALVAYQTQIVIVQWAGTHAEYDRQKFK